MRFSSHCARYLPCRRPPGGLGAALLGAMKPPRRSGLCATAEWRVWHRAGSDCPPDPCSEHVATVGTVASWNPESGLSLLVYGQPDQAGDVGDAAAPPTCVPALRGGSGR